MDYTDITDKQFLRWLYERLIHVYRVNPNEDWMQKLRLISEFA